MHTQDTPNQSAQSLYKAIGFGTLAVALLDATDGVIYAWFAFKQNPVQVLQWIASGALGSSAFSGGLGTAFLGLLMHFVISLAFVALFVFAYLRVPAIRANAVPIGLGYGAAIWLFMNLVVLPHSGVAPEVFSPGFIANGLIGHALFVGLPAALAARKWLGDSPGA
jgi:hypothetical protein